MRRVVESCLLLIMGAYLLLASADKLLPDYPSRRSGVLLVNFTDSCYVCYVTGFDEDGQRDGSVCSASLKSFDEHKKGVVKTDYYILPESHLRRQLAENSFEMSRDGRLRFYFISDSVFFNVPWDTIVKHRMFCRKIELDRRGLDSLGWMIELR